MEHVFTESMFLVGFVIFIAAILVLDMLVIDRKAHVVSIKEAGSWTAVWIILALAFAVFIYFHGDMVHGIENFNDLKLIASRYASHLKLDPNDYEGSLQQYRHYMTISYISGYLIEKTLSVDNLFVMMMIFTSFGVDKKDYQHVLNWGILGAIVLRFVFIFAGMLSKAKIRSQNSMNTTVITSGPRCRRFCMNFTTGCSRALISSFLFLLRNILAPL